jgi:hypothetical protein
VVCYICYAVVQCSGAVDSACSGVELCMQGCSGEVQFCAVER